MNDKPWWIWRRPPVPSAEPPAFHPPEAVMLAYKSLCDFWEKEKRMSSLESVFNRLRNDYRALLVAAYLENAVPLVKLFRFRHWDNWDMTGMKKR